jgi:hypothetical protein
MGLLIDIVHRERLRDPQHAARLFRALGESVVLARGFTPHADQIDRAIDAGVHDAEAQITFERGTLDRAALDALDTLALAIDGYLDVNTRGASLRVWSHIAWMHGYTTPTDAQVSAILGRPTTIPAGVTTIDEVTFKLPSANGYVPFDVETPRTAIATALFRAIAPPELTRGFCTCVAGRAREPLRAFLHALRASALEASYELPLDTAASLADHLAFDEQLTLEAGPARVTFPGGAITTYLLAPVQPADEAAWHATIDGALVRSME